MNSDTDILNRLLDPVCACLTPEVAAHIAALRADDSVQQRVESLAEKNSEGTISEAERTELEAYVRAFSLISILQAKARKVLGNAG